MMIRKHVLLGSIVALCASATALAQDSTARLQLTATVGGGNGGGCEVVLDVDSSDATYDFDLSNIPASDPYVADLTVTCGQKYGLSVASDEGQTPVSGDFALAAVGDSENTYEIPYRLRVRTGISNGEYYIDTDKSDFDEVDATNSSLRVRIGIDADAAAAAPDGVYTDSVTFTVSGLTTPT